MFNKNFFPTPPEVVVEITKGIASKSYILEPSAGKGDLIKWLANPLNGNRIDCIEIEPELVEILRSIRDIRIVGYDFLKFTPNLRYDYILMNPPFDNGCKHLLHALEVGNGAEIRCLLNSGTLDNPNTKERELLLKKIADLNGEVRRLGQCFKNAERSTYVDVSFVIVKSEISKSSIDFNNINFKRSQNSEFNADIPQTELARINYFDSIEDRYKACNLALETIAKGFAELKYYSESIVGNYFLTSLMRNIRDVESDKDFAKKLYNTGAEILKKEAWAEIVKKSKFRDILTNKAITDFNNFLENNANIAFNSENIQFLFQNLYSSKEYIFKQAILDSFDWLTQYYEENRHYIEGWKTNSQWRVNRKVIIPFRSFTGKFHRFHLIGSPNYSKIEDFEKALCYIAGVRLENIVSFEKAIAGNIEYGKEYLSHFFAFKIYKKGTIHLRFLDDYIYEQFNIIACKGKNWLKAA